MALHHAEQFFLSTFAILMLAVAHASGKDATSPTVAERKLLRSAMAGETADYSKDSDKTISAAFLKKLMFGTPEAQLPGKRVVIKGAIVQFFDVKADEKTKFMGGTPFEIVFNSCNFSSFICEGCRFRQDLRFVGTTFGITGGTGQLVLTGTQLDGSLEIVNNNTLTVGLDNARISGIADLSLPPSTALVARGLKAQALRIQASSHLNFSADHAEVQTIDVRVVGDGSGTSDVGLSDVMASSVTVAALGEGIVLNASRLKANTAMFIGGPPVGSNHTDPWTPVVAERPTLRRATIDNLDMDGFRTDYLDASGLTVKDTAAFGVDAKSVDLSSSTFNTLDWSLHSFPETTALDGISFQRFYVIPFPGSRPSISKGIDFFSKADFSGSGFSAYQTQLRSQGENAEAERLYVVMREKTRLGYWGHWFTWPLGIVDLFQQYVLGYGRSPTPPLLWSLLFVVFGAFTFHDSAKMQSKVKKPIDFSGAWYSLELFLPIVDLGVAKEWRPRATPKWRVAYARVHQIAGWVLIPVTLAAFTGVVK